MSTLDDLLGPRLPARPLCAGRAPGWDADVAGETAAERTDRHARAVQLCTRCPTLDACTALLPRLPPETTGIWAGQVRAGRGRGWRATTAPVVTTQQETTFAREAATQGRNRDPVQPAEPIERRHPIQPARRAEPLRPADVAALLHALQLYDDDPKPPANRPARRQPTPRRRLPQTNSVEYFALKIDPEGVLSPRTRRRRARYAQHAHFVRLAELATEARRAKRLRALDPMNADLPFDPTRAESSTAAASVTAS